MTEKQFIWLAAETFARSKGGKAGSHLEQGKTYETADFDPDVVAEWVRAGAAGYAGGKKPAIDLKPHKMAQGSFSKSPRMEA